MNEIRITHTNWAVFQGKFKVPDNGIRIEIRKLELLPPNTGENTCAYVRRSLPEELFSAFYYQGSWRGFIYRITIFVPDLEKILTVWAAESRIPAEIKTIFNIAEVPQEY